MKVYETRDFYLSGFLLCRSFMLEDSVREHGCTVFYFQDSPELQKTVRQFYMSETTVDPVVYGMTLRQLKGIMHAPSVSTQNLVNNNEFSNKQQGTK